MRTSFITTLIELARQDRRIYLLVGDLGYSVVEPFAREFPDRFVNVGVAEQNMTGVAAGLALSGKVVFLYSIGNFPTLRCLEQIRNDVCYHRANVKIVSVGGGVSYGAQGITHHATEDIAIMRALPNMVVMAPADAVEAELATKALASHEGPGYLRLGKTGEPVIHQKRPGFQIGKAIQLRKGDDLTLIFCGAISFNVIQAADRLEKDGLSLGILSMTTVKPIDAAALDHACRTTAGIVTIEEHSLVGGLGSAVAEALADLGQPRTPLLRLGLPDAFVEDIGSQEYIRERNGLSIDGIYHSVRSFWDRISLQPK